MPYSDETWKQYVAVLESSFGPCSENIITSPVPFELGQDVGGNPDILIFESFLRGKLFVTAGLLGSNQPINKNGKTYELAVAHNGEEMWGVSIIQQLAHYSLKNPLSHGDTMSIESVVPEDATVKAFQFLEIANFQLNGRKSAVICCVGITDNELWYSRSSGVTQLTQRLGEGYLLTELQRKSTV